MSDNKQLTENALKYHAEGRPGKVQVIPTKPTGTQMDLTLAYSPGVAAPCLEIEKDPNKAYEYTDKGNLVAVISNGTAVLGLGNIRAMSGKPVMEGKGLLFKILLMSMFLISRWMLLTLTSSARQSRPLLLLWRYQSGGYQGSLSVLPLRRD